MASKIAFLPGDGVGPEVANAAKKVLDAAAKKHELSLEYADCFFGGAAIDAMGDPFPAETKEACLSADAIFLGAIGGPKWDGAKKRPEAGLLEMRKALGVFANLRPVSVAPGMEQLSPLREERAKGVDLLIVRELTGGLYFGERTEGYDLATDQCLYTKDEVTRVARIAFEAAKKRGGRVASVDKANVLATSRLWRSAVKELHEAEYKDVELTHVLVDAMAMKLIQAPAEFDVILTENLFGDILSDEASVLSGSIGLAPSASLGEGPRGLYEPIHGSAPDIAGQGKANPAGAIMSAAMLLRYSLGESAAADNIEAAVSKALASGRGTGDIGGEDDTASFTDAVVELI
ncbi:3-isopropylmalate dehydrogenase [Hyphococcus luteus]|uniref:3-isopropylmalate dehydrogenase n=1 Tax=Hyphococcus luteus TaxID=2058213 RepID=A0A2S7JZ64_9PROT|nr:3-isopropylmalate dehydrogenase [Marinicaulis flavus]PQA85547.1 3-isopropylmalate dehydrogenase [Marinicaulis flavus]